MKANTKENTMNPEINKEDILWLNEMVLEGFGIIFQSENTNISNYTVSNEPCSGIEDINIEANALSRRHFIAALRGLHKGTTQGQITKRRKYTACYVLNMLKNENMQRKIIERISDEDFASDSHYEPNHNEEKNRTRFMARYFKSAAELDNLINALQN